MLPFFTIQFVICISNAKTIRASFNIPSLLSASATSKMKWRDNRAYPRIIKKEHQGGSEYLDNTIHEGQLKCFKFSIFHSLMPGKACRVMCTLQRCVSNVTTATYLQ